MFEIGEAARQTGVSVETIRYYEREGVIAVPIRSSSGRRLFSEEAVAELGFIRKCRQMDFSLAEAATLWTLAKDPDEACDAAARLARRHLEDVQRRLADLQHLQAMLQRLVNGCTEDRPVCPVIAELTSGPTRAA